MRREAIQKLTCILFCIFVLTGFFPEGQQTNPLREPTQAEIDALIDPRTIDFYTKLFRREYGDTFDSFQFECTYYFSTMTSLMFSKG